VTDADLDVMDRRLGDYGLSEGLTVHDLIADYRKLRRVVADEADFLRRISEWDMLYELADGTRPAGMGYVADGPMWKREIAKRRAALAALEPQK
jgi:hypothetical protein